MIINGKSNYQSYPTRHFINKFYARLHNKRAIVRKGPVYTSNRAPMGVYVLE